MVAVTSVMRAHQILRVDGATAPGDFELLLRAAAAGVTVSERYRSPKPDRLQVHVIVTTRSAGWRPDCVAGSCAPHRRADHTGADH